MSDLLPDPLRELLRSDALSVAKDVRVMLQRDVRISMAHEPGDDVDRSAGFEQLLGYSMAEGMYAYVNAFRSFNPKFRHGPMNAVFHNVVGEEGLALGVGEEIAV